MQKEEDEKTSPEYLSGFNAGYELAQKLPDLAEKVMGALQDKDDDRAQGMKDGRSQHMLEQARDRLPGADKGHSSPGPDKSKEGPSKEAGPER